MQLSLYSNHEHGEGGELEPSIITSHMANDNLNPPCAQGYVNPKIKLERKANPEARRSKRLMREKMINE
jgi:hypothetical protein